MDQFTRSMRPYYESSTSFFCRTYRTAYRGRTLNSKQESDNISKKKENIENGMNFWVSNVIIFDAWGGNLQHFNYPSAANYQWSQLSQVFDFWVSVYSLVTSQGTCLVDRLNLDISNAIYAICRDIWWGKSTAEMVSLWRSCCVCLDHTHQSVTLSSVPLFWNLIMDAECGPERSFCCLSALRILKIQLGQTEKLIKFWTDGRTDRIRILWAFRVKFGKSFQYFRWFFMCFTIGFWFHTFYFFISHFSRYRRMYTCICKVHGLKATCLDMALCLCTSTEILNTVWFLSEYANTLST